LVAGGQVVSQCISGDFFLVLDCNLLIPSRRGKEVVLLLILLPFSLFINKKIRSSHACSRRRKKNLDEREEEKISSRGIYFDLVLARAIYKLQLC
jgi:hypothetical protein